jgi:hypothetical protein
MKHKWIIITLSIFFFLTALTFYLNRVIFPKVIKKIAIEQAENFLKRKVEIESLHFNWLKGVVVNKLKIYQNDSTDVFIQAEKVSIGVIFIPGIKQHKLIFPSITVQSPSAHLIRQGNDQWNFSDLLAPPPSTDNKPSPVTVSVGGINVVDGKIRVDDTRPEGLWSELIDQLNMKIGLSYQGISFNGSLLLPQKQGAVSINGSYWPLGPSLKATVGLQNIKPLDYLSFVPVKLPVTVINGTINELTLQVNYDPQHMDAQGHWSIKNIDVRFEKQTAKTDMEASNAFISIGKSITVKGQFALANTNIDTSALTIKGALKADVDDFTMNSSEDLSFTGNLQTNLINVQLPHDQSFQGQISAKIIKALWQKDSAKLEGAIALNQTLVTLDEHKNIKGDFKFNNLKIIKYKNLTNGNADLDFENFDIRMPGQVFKGNLVTHQLTLNMDDENNIKINTALDLTNMEAITEQANIKTSLYLKNVKIFLDQNHQILDAQIQGKTQNALLDLSKQGNLKANANFDVHAIYPYNNPSQLQYNGTIAIAEGQFDGLAFGSLSGINLTTDIKTDQADIQNLSLSVLDTPIKASGRITHFAKPLLKVQVESQRLDLSKIKEAAPDLLKPFGLTIDGETSFNLKFEGLAADPLSGKINAAATLKDVNVTSSVLKQSFKNISGSLNADGDSLSWDNFTATIMDYPLTSSGHLTNFKNPNVTTSLSWQGLELKAQINKDSNTVNIKDISGHYLTASFNATGNIDLSGKDPQLDLKSNAKFKLEDLNTLMPNLKTSLDPLKLSGQVTASSTLKGPASNWKQWTLTTNAHSDLASISGFKFNNLNVDVNQEEGRIKKFNITSDLYDGNLNIVTTADLNEAPIPFETALHIENVNLAKLKNDTGAKDEDLRGFIALTSVVKGNVKDIVNLKGEGALNISQGYLMKKEFSSLFMIPELSNLIFTEATGNFTIADQKVSTQNFVLKSEGANLNGVGWIGFNQQIQFELHPEFNTATIAQSDSFRKGPSALIALAAGKYLTFTIDGTLSKPVVHTIKKPTELIKKTGEILKDNVGQILQGFFQ